METSEATGQRPSWRLSNKGSADRLLLPQAFTDYQSGRLQNPNDNPWEE